MKLERSEEKSFTRNDEENWLMRNRVALNDLPFI